MLLVANGSVFTRNAQTPFIPNGAVAIDGDTIVEVGPECELKAKYPDAEYVDAQGNLIMPGLINCHTHIYSGLARGLAIKGCNPTNFLENLEQQWWKIDDNLTLDGTKASAYATILDSIRDGVTTIFDHHASFCEIPGSLFTIKDAAQELGMRSCLCYEVSDRRGQEKCDQAIAENAEFAQWAAKERRDNDNHMIAAMFGGHATFTLSDETMDKMAEANNGLTGFHIHVCEGMNDVWDSRLNRGGISPVERLLQHNLLGPDTMLGHCIHVTPAEMDIVKESGTWLVNNPESNMGNAVGCAPVLEFFRRGIPVCMGTDAYTHDMLESLKVFLIIQRHNAAMPNVGWCEAMTMLFENNAKMASKYFDRKLGVLEAGAAADVIVMDYKPFTPLSEENIDGHMLFGMMGKNCRTTIINGRILYKDREFVGIDEEKINAWTMAESKKLWSTFLSYYEPGHFAYSLKPNVDDRGSFTEFLRTPERGQVSINVSRPGITKGNHWHMSKWERFLVVSGTASIKLRKVGEDAEGNPFPVDEYVVSGSEMRVVEMIPGYTHSITNLSDTEDLVTVMWANEPFDSENPDTYFETV